MPSFKPNEMVEKQATIKTPTTASQLPPPSAMGSITSKPLFGSAEKSQHGSLGFGTPGAEKAQPTDSPLAGIASSKATPFQTSTASPFSFATKPIDTPNQNANMFGTASSLFSFGQAANLAGAPTSGQKTSLFALNQSSTTAPPPLPKSSEDSLNLSKPLTTAVASGASGKIPLLLTPTASNKTPILNPAATVNTAPKVAVPAIKSAAPSIPLGSAGSLPNSNVNVQKLSTPASDQPVGATVNTFKFDLGSLDSKTNDQSADNKENSVPSTIANTSSPFSFALGNSNTAQPSPEIASIKSTTASPTIAAATTALPLATILMSTQTAVTSSASSSTIGFSFAKASAESSIFGGAIGTATTNISTATNTTTSSTAVSSSTDPSNIFQGFNICKPNVADSSNRKKFPFI